MTPGMYYIWNKETGEVEETTSFESWGRAFEDQENRVVKVTRINCPQSWQDIGGQEFIVISTVFLGTNMNFSGNGAPILWETMIFGLPPSHELADYQVRYDSLQAAKTGHERAYRIVNNAMRNAGVGGWKYYGPKAYDYNHRLNWDEFARIIANHLSGKEVKKAAWRDLNGDYDKVKDTYATVAKAIIEHYEKTMKRRGIVQIKRDDLQNLRKMLGPSRGELVDRVDKALSESDPDQSY